MPATNLTLSTDMRVGTQVVYIKRLWSGTWEQVLGLECDRAMFGTLPTVGEGIFLRPFGLGMYPGHVTGDYRSKLSILDWFIKLVYTPADSTEDAINWYGVVVTEERQRFDRVNDPTTGALKLGGVQVFHAMELAYLLGKRPIDKGYVATEGAVLEIGVAPDFNARGVANQAVASSGFGTQFAEEFGEDNAEYWSSRTAVEYLLERFPLEKGNETGSTFPLSVANPDLIPDWDRPTIRQEGSNLLELLGRILDIDRGLGCFLTVDETSSPNPVKIQVFTHVATDTNLGGEEGEVLSANPTQYNLIVDYRPDLGTAIKLTTTERFARLIIRGGKRRAVCSLDPVDDWEGDWTTDEQTEYNDGASLQAGYSALSLDAKKDSNKDIRNNPLLRHVYQRFRIADDWDGKTAAGASTAPEDRKPVLVDDEDATKVYGNWKAGRKLLQSLPLYQGVDYSGSKIAGGEIPEIKDEETPWMPPAMYVPTKADTAKWFEASAGGLGTKGGTDNRTWSFAVRCEHDKPRFQLNVIGDEQHNIADSEFTPLSGADSSTDVRYDWRDFLLTVCFEECRHVEVRYPDPIPDADNVACITEKLFDLGDGFRLDYVAPQTVVGIDKTDNGLLRSDGGFARDDRPKMKVLAEQLYSYYSQVKQVVSIEKVGLTKQLWLGDYVAQLGADTDASALTEPVATVVTSVSLSFPSGTVGSPPDPPMQSWTTSQGELDALIVPPKKGKR
jgi:hypothetical protein